VEKPQGVQEFRSVIAGCKRGLERERLVVSHQFT